MFDEHFWIMTEILFSLKLSFLYYWFDNKLNTKPECRWIWHILIYLFLSCRYLQIYLGYLCLSDEKVIFVTTLYYFVNKNHNSAKLHHLKLFNLYFKTLMLFNLKEKNAMKISVFLFLTHSKNRAIVTICTRFSSTCLLINLSSININSSPPT